MSQLSDFSSIIWKCLESFITIISTNQILSGAVATLIAAVLIFIFKEYFKPPPNFSGVFEIECETLKSAYNPYLRLKTFYTLVLICDNNSIEGYIEKTKDVESNNSIRTYTGKHRSIGEVRGVIKRNYLRKNHASLNIKMDGELRNYTILLYFRKVNTDIMYGKFWSTAADSSGDVKWQRSAF
ncbi:hypothetical protein [Enterobacter cloacae]|uniref:hypothetical protein n=1 Tax=Enterobacter cloacae TaxID=550 RepID=UPI000AA10272|nr:hypothetical protein [Enterobacter cloacae]SSG93574.1 Uncharacterised protein [Klebsiella pneumoniae]MCU6206079.1 hypothetical protein [Enterobacter cloacae]HAS1007081.1 hypothetical protein [Enterobacter cloacae]HAS1145071.1 hypothetical protein [Enterobacter cloacae]HAS1180629.1 hypothetical protein [Enterobacter cloacae]